MGKLMISISSPEVALKICRICNDFKFEIDACIGRSRIAIDAKSALGMQELVGCDVEIRPVHKDIDYEPLFNRLVEIGGRLEEDFKEE